MDDKLIDWPPTLAAMQTDATLVYSEPLIRGAALSFWRRTVGIGFFVALLTSFACIAFLAVQGGAGWLIGAMTAILVSGLLFVTGLYVVHYKGMLRKLREMNDRIATFHADDSSFSLSSSRGTTTLQWSAVKELWKFPQVWLLLYSKAQFSTLPVECLPQELQVMICQKIKAAGGKVDD